MAAKVAEELGELKRERFRCNSTKKKLTSNFLVGDAEGPSIPTVSAPPKTENDTKIDHEDSEEDKDEEGTTADTVAGGEHLHSSEVIAVTDRQQRRRRRRRGGSQKRRRLVRQPPPRAIHHGYWCPASSQEEYFQRARLSNTETTMLIERRVRRSDISIA